jgi:nicotinate-nucleotide pyrophosphorylase (carboxylating)
MTDMVMPESIKNLIRLALEEDIGGGDITSSLLIPDEARTTAMFVAKGSFIIAGLPFAEEVFRAIEKDIYFRTLVEEGARVKKGAVLAEIKGRTKTLLSGERVSLNILQHLSGIATTTNAFVNEVKGLKAKIVDTRKTLPGLRYLEKYAVRTGGGGNHRFGLYDGILIKDNHIEAVGSIRKAIEMSKEGYHLLKIEVEVENLKDFKDALDAEADIIMLDNMTVKDMKEAVKMNKGRSLLEASGNVSLDNVRKIAETGVDLISIGAITHSAPAADISMKIVE